MVKKITLGEYLRRLRGDRTLHDIQNLTGLDVSTLNRLESGGRIDPKASTIKALSDGFKIPDTYIMAAFRGVDPDDLYKDEPNPHKAAEEDLAALLLRAYNQLKKKGT